MSEDQVPPFLETSSLETSSEESTRPAVLRVGLLGCGVVGSAAARILLQEAEEVATAGGVKLELARVAVRDPSKRRPVELPSGILTDDARDVVTDPTIDVIVEVIGGIELPRELILTALHAGKPVVTANKELIARNGQQLAQVAVDEETDLFFEASVGGAIPIVQALRGALRADRITRIDGVVNGTTNFILERMEETSCNLENALEEARALGYAEQDPSADLDGEDAASKLAILAGLAFGGWLTLNQVKRQGIVNITPEDVRGAASLGYSVKLVASAELVRDSVSLSVGPALVRKGSTLGCLPDVLNAVRIECRNAGPLIFQGRGAGGDPSASAVVSDLVSVARNRIEGSNTPLVTGRGPLNTVSLQRAPRRYFLRFEGGADFRSEGQVHRGLKAAGVPVEIIRTLTANRKRKVSLVSEPLEEESLDEVRQALGREKVDLQAVLPVLEVA